MALSIGLRLGLSAVRAPGGPNAIISAGAIGWYDFSDASTLSSGSLTGGVGDEIGLVLDKSGHDNNPHQPVLADAPRLATGQINGRDGLQFLGTDHLLLTPVTIRACFFLVSDATDGTPSQSVAPVLGTEFNDPSATHQHIFVRADGQTDFDISVDGQTDYTGTVYSDTGGTGTGENITISGLSVSEREGTRLFYVALDSDMPLVDVIGALRAGASQLFNDGTLFGEIVLLPTAITAAQSNAIGNLIAPKWGLTWPGVGRTAGLATNRLNVPGVDSG